MEPQKPTVGRIVHYNTGSAPHAALVIAVAEDGSCSLQVCNEGGTWNTKHGVKQGADAGTWCWPPRA